MGGPGGGGAGAIAALTLLAGCAGDNRRLDRALLAGNQSTKAPVVPAEDYCLHCADVLAVTVAGHPDWSGAQLVDTDGRLRLSEGVAVRVEGQTADDAGRHIAERLGVDPTAVEARVAAFNSQQVYLHGSVADARRAIAYRGPETVVDLLRRVGGLTEGAALADIQVVRAHVADGRPPEVFHVDLKAILLRNDATTNVYLEPFDQVYIGETRRHCIACRLPPCLRPLFEAVCGTTAKRRSGDLPGS